MHQCRHFAAPAHVSNPEALVKCRDTCCRISQPATRWRSDVYDAGSRGGTPAQAGHCDRAPVGAAAPRGIASANYIPERTAHGLAGKTRRYRTLALPCRAAAMGKVAFTGHG